jgi:hypothetical protein
LSLGPLGHDPVFAGHDAGPAGHDRPKMRSWDKRLLTDSVKRVRLAMRGRAVNAHALTQLRNRSFEGRIAAIVKYADEVETLRRLGGDAVFHVDDEAGTASADDALAGPKAG